MRYIAFLILALASSLSHADGNADAGKAKSAVCAACHGADGMATIPGYPHLAGQNADYMVAQLKAFKSGDRKGGNAIIMAPMAAGLSEQDMKDLAAYFNSLGK